MESNMKKTILSISEQDINGILFQKLFLETDNGNVLPVWSKKAKHEFSVGDTVELGLISKKNALTVRVIYPTTN